MEPLRPLSVGGPDRLSIGGPVEPERLVGLAFGHPARRRGAIAGSPAPPPAPPAPAADRALRPRAFPAAPRPNLSPVAPADRYADRRCSAGSRPLGGPRALRVPLARPRVERDHGAGRWRDTRKYATTIPNGTATANRTGGRRRLRRPATGPVSPMNVAAMPTTIARFVTGSLGVPAL